jgi:lipopolysaccharide export LptBFGC system permease protein LptF
MRRPGQWLRVAAARLCARQTLDRMIDPIVADIQLEYEEAVRSGRFRRAAWIRVSGYCAFWKAIALNAVQAGPRALWTGVAADDWMLGRMILYSALAFITVSLLLTASPAIVLYSRVQNLKLTLLLLPQAMALGIPVGLSLGIVWSGYDPRTRAGRTRGVLVLGVAATLLAFAVVLSLPVANQAFRLEMANQIDSGGITSYSLPRGPNELSLSELATMSRNADAAGRSNIARRYMRAYHLRFALPATTFVLGLLAVAICGVMRGRARRLLAVVISIGMYWAILAFGDTDASMPAVVAGWAPNVVLMAIALAVLKVSSRPSPALCE